MEETPPVDPQVDLSTPMNPPVTRQVNIVADHLEIEAVYLTEEKAKKGLENERLRIENDLLKIQLEAEREDRAAKLKNYKQDTSLRKKFSWAIYRFLSFWMLFMLIIVIMAGYGHSGYFVLSESVLVTLLGSTSVSVIGIFMVVARYFFPQPTTIEKPNGENNSV